MGLMSALKQSGVHVVSILLVGFLFSCLVPYAFILICWMMISYFLPEPWFHKFDDFMWGWYQRLVVFLYEHYSGVEVMISGDIPAIEENSIVISNHQSTLDWIVANFVAVRQNKVGHVRYVFKNSLKYYPLCGLAFAKHGGIFVKRDGKYNDQKMRENIEMLVRRKASIFLMIYPEGTRFNPCRSEVLEKSQSYASKMGLKQLKQVLTPRVKAFDTALNCLQNHVNAIYDITVIYDDRDRHEAGKRGKSLGTIEFLDGVCKRVYIKFTRIPIDQVLASINRYSEDQSSEASPSMKWLHERFTLKDELFRSFYPIAPEKESPLNEHSDGEPIKWRLSSLPLTATLPAFILAVFFHCVLYYPLVRLLYCLTATVGAVLGIFYCHYFA